MTLIDKNGERKACYEARLAGRVACTWRRVSLIKTASSVTV
jgi:hypothetical protein